MGSSQPDFETRAVHAGVGQSLDFKPTAPSIHPSTTFTYDRLDRVHEALEPLSADFAYSRNANPTVRALEKVLATLEETEDAVAFGSGMAALHAALLATGMRPGETVLAARDLYGRTQVLLGGLFGRLGFLLEVVDTGDLEAVAKALGTTGATVLVFEPISNPILRVADAPALIDLAHRHGARVVIDNTFASPYLFRPGSWGADFTIHSATKYLGGHGDVTAGLVACDEDIARVLRDIRTSTGGILGPFDAWLVLRGIKTLAVRMQRHCENALAFARWLAARDDVRHVNYPALSADPGRPVVDRLFRDGLAGGMVSFETGFDVAGVVRLMESLRLAVPGTSLGDVQTLVLCPALSSHRNLSKEERRQAGIPDGLVRVSVGLESVRDLIADFESALTRAAAHD